MVKKEKELYEIPEWLKINFLLIILFNKGYRINNQAVVSFVRERINICFRYGKSS